LKDQEKIYQWLNANLKSEKTIGAVKLPVVKGGEEIRYENFIGYRD
jgi:hypothetical protein